MPKRPSHGIDPCGMLGVITHRIARRNAGSIARETNVCLQGMVCYSVFGAGDKPAVQGVLSRPPSRYHLLLLVCARPTYEYQKILAEAVCT